jgi:hypothetical protein
VGDDRIATGVNLDQREAREQPVGRRMATTSSWLGSSPASDARAALTITMTLMT